MLSGTLTQCQVHASSPIFCLPRLVHVELSLAREVNQSYHRIFPIFKFENGSRTTCSRFTTLTFRALHGNHIVMVTLAVYPRLLWTTLTISVRFVFRHPNPSITNDLHDLPQWFHWNVYIYVIVNRQGSHNIRNGIAWAQPGHGTFTWTHQKFESFKKI